MNLAFFLLSAAVSDALFLITALAVFTLISLAFRKALRGSSQRKKLDEALEAEQVQSITVNGDHYYHAVDSLIKRGYVFMKQVNVYTCILEHKNRSVVYVTLSGEGTSDTNTRIEYYYA